MLQILRHVTGWKKQNKPDLNKKLLTNDTRKCKPNQMQRGTTPCCGCSTEQLEQELVVAVVCLYVPYGQFFLFETTFYLCPSSQYVKQTPPYNQ